MRYTIYVINGYTNIKSYIKTTMQYIKDIAGEQPTGFSFDNFKRNQFLRDKKIGNELKTVKTGTTIAGMIFKVFLPEVRLFRTGLF